jgi:transcriptional regulator with XRE-family HTH domain
LNQELIGALLGVSPNYIAQLESARMPLRYFAAKAFVSSGKLSVHWLAVGEGPMMIQTPLPSAAELGISPRDLLSRVYATHREKLTGWRAPGVSLFDLRQHLDSLGAEWSMRVPSTRVEEFVRALEITAAQFLAPIDAQREDAMRSVLERKVQAEAAVAVASKRQDLLQETESSPLTHVRTSVTVPPMRWTVDSLLKAVRERTQERGGKTRLARFMGVPLPRVSEWLSGVYEPNASATLKLLEWVTEADVKAKTPASGTNTGKGPKRPAMKSSENDNLNRPRKRQ